jgi:hypothetical protein
MGNAILHGCDPAWPKKKRKNKIFERLRKE